MKNYLSSKNLNCTYSEDGYLQFDSVKNIIWNYKYMYIAGRRYNSSGEVVSAHAFVLHGYIYDGVSKMYSVWNPWYNYKQTIDANTRVITTEDTRTYTWNRGYIYAIR